MIIKDFAAEARVMLLIHDPKSDLELFVAALWKRGGLEVSELMALTGKFGHGRAP